MADMVLSAGTDWENTELSGRNETIIAVINLFILIAFSQNECYIWLSYLAPLGFAMTEASGGLGVKRWWEAEQILIKKAAPFETASYLKT